MLLEVCLCVVIFKTFFFKAQSHFTLTALHEYILCHTLALHTRHLSCVSDGIGQCLLPQTSSLATCDSTLGGLPNGLGILRSGPAYANIFLTRVYRKSLCDIFLPPHEEQRMQCTLWFIHSRVQQICSKIYGWSKQINLYYKIKKIYNFVHNWLLVLKRFHTGNKCN